ncbi:hypothetical protein XENOCAPTIV_020420 [Xenoophorus captivus]|uniref:Uncharacterized protein n=1 Tax=Xenoophorus captivus TaxID=1517983 RepID=A0ABV0R9P0_9TELE
MLRSLSQSSSHPCQCLAARPHPCSVAWYLRPPGDPQHVEDACSQCAGDHCTQPPCYTDIITAGEVTPDMVEGHLILQDFGGPSLLNEDAEMASRFEWSGLRPSADDLRIHFSLFRMWWWRARASRTLKSNLIMLGRCRSVFHDVVQIDHRQDM